MSGSSAIHVEALKAEALSAFQDKDFEKTVGLLSPLTSVLTDDAGVWKILGMARFMVGQTDAAIDDLKRCLDLEPAEEHARGLYLQLLDRTGRAEELLAACIAGIDATPENAAFYETFTSCVQKATKREEPWMSVAIGPLIDDVVRILLHHAKADPTVLRAIQRMAQYMCVDGRAEQAVAVFTQTLWPLDTGTPANRDADMLTKKFHDFARDYDGNVDSVVVANQFEAFLVNIVGSRSALSVLDGACGTGLVGQHLKPRARRLVGIDLSAEMLDHAREKDLYDDLHYGDLTLTLSSLEESFDLITCSWALFYLSDLSGFFNAAAARLAEGGLLVVTVYPCTDEHDVLKKERDQPEYCHSRRYLRRLATEAGLTEIAVEARGLCAHPGFYAAFRKGGSGGIETPHEIKTTFNSLWNGNRFEDAIAFLDGHPETWKCPSLLKTLNMHAVAILNWPLAEKAARQYLTIDPDDPSTGKHLGDALLAMGRGKEAAEIFATLPLNPNITNSEKIALNAGVGLEAAGDLDAAMKWYLRAHDIDPDYKAARYRFNRLEERLKSGHITIIERLTQPDRFAEIVNTVQFQPLVPRNPPDDFFKKYWPHYHKGMDEDYSFAVLLGETPAAMVWCVNANDDFRIQGHLVSAPIDLAPDLNKDEARIALGAALKQIHSLADGLGGNVALIAGGAQIPKSLAEAGAPYDTGKSILRLLIADLSQNEAELRSGLRKSYRSLINWGSRTMTMTYINRDNPDWSGFDHFRTLHFETRFKQTGISEPGPDAFFIAEALVRKWVEEGRGEVSIGFIDGIPVAASVFIDDGDTTIYVAGRYTDLKNRGASHWPIFDAMLRAKDRGIKKLFLGHIAPYETTKKLESIFFFKSGFVDKPIEEIILAVSTTHT